jgi:hypothetical protein
MKPRRRPITLDTLGLACLLEALNDCDKPGCDGNHWWRDSEARPWVCASRRNAQNGIFGAGRVGAIRL